MMIPCRFRSDLLPCPSAFAPADQLGGPTTHSVLKPSFEAILGVVVFLTHKGERAEAILDVEGGWRCPRLPVLDRVLNALFEPSRDAGVEMPFGHADLIRVAAWLRGEAEIRRP